MPSYPNLDLLERVLLRKEAEALRRESLVGCGTPALTSLVVVFSFPPTLARLFAFWLPLAPFVKTYMRLIRSTRVSRPILWYWRKSLRLLKLMHLLCLHLNDRRLLNHFSI